MVNEPLDLIFAPRNIAVIGVSGNSERFSVAQRFIRGLVSFGFKGGLYPVHPLGGELMGMKIYQNLGEVPDSIDLVVSCIPAEVTSQLLRDCIAKGVKAIHIFTSGFGEIEDAVGGKLEKELLQTARDGGIRIIGPNCMGIYNPASGLTFAHDYHDQKGFPNECGCLGLISQSGGNAVSFIREATSRGVFFSKAVSYGNAADLNESDFLEYLMKDSRTGIIAMYTEGVKEGRRFFNIIRKAAKLKPVIVYKGGVTEAGARASASHTGALAGSAGIWRSLLKQAGAIQANNMQEITDVAVTLIKMPEIRGTRTAIIGSGGGSGVRASDDCTEAGLHIPLLDSEVRKKLVEIFGSEAGSIYRNPVDISPFSSKHDLIEALKTIVNSGGIDLAIVHFIFDAWAIGYRSDIIGPYTQALIELKEITEKPLAVVLHDQETAVSKQMASRMQENLVAGGLAVFTSFSRAAGAIRKVYDYYRWKHAV